MMRALVGYSPFFLLTTTFSSFSAHGAAPELSAKTRPGLVKAAVPTGRNVCWRCTAFHAPYFCAKSAAPAQKKSRPAGSALQVRQLRRISRRLLFLVVFLFLIARGGRDGLLFFLLLVLAAAAGR